MTSVLNLAARHDKNNNITRTTAAYRISLPRFLRKQTSITVQIMGTKKKRERETTAEILSPKIITDKAGDSKEMRAFIEMCFDPKSPVNGRLKEALFQVLNEGKEET